MRRRGTIIRVTANNYGWIRPDDWDQGQKDHFFHASGLSPALEFNEQLQELRVSYEVEVDGKGRTKAVGITAAHG